MKQQELLAQVKLTLSENPQRQLDAERAVGSLFSALGDLQALGHFLHVETGAEKVDVEEFPKLVYKKLEDGVPAQTAMIYSQEEADALGEGWGAEPHPALPTESRFPSSQQNGTPQLPLEGASPEQLQAADDAGRKAADAGYGAEDCLYSKGSALATAWVKGFNDFHAGK